MPSDRRVVDAAEMKKVGRQIRLPWSKAVEIAVKSMKVRFGRSVVTTASIVLAIAFLMSILTSTTLVTSLKTEPGRRILRLREQAAAAKRGKIAGITFPSVPLESTLAEIQALEKEFDAAKADPLARRMLRARIDEAAARRDVLRSPGAADLMAEWRVRRVRVQLVEAENEWQLLCRKLQSEGYTDVEPEVSAENVPPRMPFVQMVLQQMDPRDKWLAALAALVCFVGIWNAMLMSVHERFREIGTMKCLGALESFIIKLYFLESAFIGLAGTLLGILAGFLLSMVRAVWAFGFGPVLGYFDWAGALQSALGTLLIGALLSVGAAIFPARSAAKMDPVVAMRVDE